MNSYQYLSVIPFMRMSEKKKRTQITQVTANQHKL